MTRIEKLQKKLKRNEGVILFDEANRRYYTGIHTSNGYVLVSKNSAVFYTDFRYITVARMQVTDMPVALIEKGAPTEAKTFFGKENVNIVLLEMGSLVYSEAKRLMDVMPGVSFVDGDKLLGEFRAVKGRDELAAIRKAQKITDKTFKYICGYIAKNKNNHLTERRIAVEIEYYMQKHGSGKPAFDTIVASGENSACPHSVPGNREIREGDFVTMDFGATYNGYCSDMTRTVAIGTISDKQKSVYETVLQAQLLAMKEIRAGVIGKEVDGVARGYLASQGYGTEYFGHGLGHSLGLYIHESPCFNTRCTDAIPAHAVLSVEPGVYIAGEFGVRIEDIVLLTNDGCIDLTESDKSLIIL